MRGKSLQLAHVGIHMYSGDFSDSTTFVLSRMLSVEGICFTSPVIVSEKCTDTSASTERTNAL